MDKKKINPTSFSAFSLHCLLCTVEFHASHPCSPTTSISHASAASPWLFTQGWVQPGIPPCNKMYKRAFMWGISMLESALKEFPFSVLALVKKFREQQKFLADKSHMWKQRKGAQDLSHPPKEMRT